MHTNKNRKYYQFLTNCIPKQSGLTLDHTYCNVYIFNYIRVSVKYHEKKQNKEIKQEEQTGKISVPILLHIVTSSSPTVLESSTMIVLTAPSNILIFWGLCFFLYSRISCPRKKAERRGQINEPNRGARNVRIECERERENEQQRG